MFLLEKGFVWLACGSGADGSRASTETLGLVLRDSRSGGRHLRVGFFGSALLNSGDFAFSGEFPSELFANFA